MKFFLSVGKALVIFNFISIFFLLLTIFVYSLIQYGFEPLVAVSQTLFSDPGQLYTVLNLVFILPNMLDYAFLVLIIIFVLDVLYFSWKSEKGSIYTTMAFTLIGLPVWVYFLGKFNEMKDWALSFLGVTLTNQVNMPIFTYMQQNSIYFAIILFIVAIFIRSVDWGNVKGFITKDSNDTNIDESTNLNELLKQ